MSRDGRKAAPRRRGRLPRRPDPTSQEWQEKLARLVQRKRRGRTNGEIAEAAGLYPDHFNRILSGERPGAALVTVQAILEALPASWAEFGRA